jgi:hypothetical protein
VKNEEVLQSVEEERNILHTPKRRKVNWVGHILRRNCLLKRVIEGKIEVKRRRRRRNQLLNGLKKTRRYWKLKEEVLANSLWKTL